VTFDTRILGRRSRDLNAANFPRRRGSIQKSHEEAERLALMRQAVALRDSGAMLASG
jgi:hypothetical protein